MSLEEKIAENTAELKKLNANFEKLFGKGGGSAAASSGDGEKKGPGRPKKEASPKSEHSAEEVKAIIVKVKEAVSADAAKKIIADTGAEKLAALLKAPELFDDAYEAAEAALKDAADEEL